MMQAFSLDTLKRVNRVLARLEPEQLVELEDGSPLRLQTMHVSLYVGDTQVAYGAMQQKKGRNGEFTTDRSGLRITLKFLQAISGIAFRQEPIDAQQGVEEYFRGDLPIAPTLVRDFHLERTH